MGSIMNFPEDKLCMKIMTDLISGMHGFDALFMIRLTGRVQFIFQLFDLGLARFGLLALLQIESDLELVVGQRTQII